jgi:hypothetical protein
LLTTLDSYARKNLIGVPNDDRPETIVDTLVWRPEGTSEPFTLELPGYFADVYLER